MDKPFCIWLCLLPSLHIQQKVFGHRLLLPSAFSYRANNEAGAAMPPYIEGRKKILPAGYRMLISFWLQMERKRCLLRSPRITKEEPKCQ